MVFELLTIRQMPTKYHAHLTLFCLTDRECADIPTELNLENIFAPSPSVTTENFTTPFPFPEWPESFVQADYTHTLMWLYASFNVAWAVTCCIVIGKWKERAVEDSC